MSHPRQHPGVARFVHPRSGAGHRDDDLLLAGAHPRRVDARHGLMAKGIARADEPEVRRRVGGQVRDGGCAPGQGRGSRGGSRSANGCRRRNGRWGSRRRPNRSGSHGRIGRCRRSGSSRCNGSRRRDRCRRRNGNRCRRRSRSRPRERGCQSMSSREVQTRTMREPEMGMGERRRQTCHTQRQRADGDQNAPYPRGSNSYSGHKRPFMVVPI